MLSYYRYKLLAWSPGDAGKTRQTIRHTNRQALASGPQRCAAMAATEQRLLTQTAARATHAQVAHRTVAQWGVIGT
jgi:hypothetical protein